MVKTGIGGELREPSKKLSLTTVYSNNFKVITIDCG